MISLIPCCIKDTKEMVEYIAQDLLKQTSLEATILLYSPALDPHLEKMTQLADRAFCICNESAAAKGRGKPEARMTG